MWVWFKKHLLSGINTPSNQQQETLTATHIKLSSSRYLSGDDHCFQICLFRAWCLYLAEVLNLACLRFSEVEVEVRSRVRGWAGSRSKWDHGFEIELGRGRSEIASSRLSEVEVSSQVWGWAIPRSKPCREVELEIRWRGRGWSLKQKQRGVGV